MSKTYPHTSALAQKQVQPKLSERRKQVLEIIDNNPSRTAGELSVLMLDKYRGILPVRTCVETPHKVLSQLERLNLASRGHVRKCTDSGYEAYTWNITTKGTTALSTGLMP